MTTKASRSAMLALGAPLLLLATPALALDDKPPAKQEAEKKKDEAAKKDDTGRTDDEIKKDAEKKAEKKDEDAKKDDTGKKDEATDFDPKLDPFEDPLKTYRFIGVRFRDAIAPKFIFNWFANGGRNLNIPMVGPEFITRRDHLEIAVALMYADYGMDPFLFQSKSDPPNSWELVQSKLKLGYAMVDIMYEIPLEKRGDKTGRFAFLIGGGVGVAGVFGQLYRSQAYPTSQAAAGNSGDASQWRACTKPGQQGTGQNLSNTYCDLRSNHFAGADGTLTSGYSEASWANGGSKPLVFPWLAPQVSFRYKPIKQLQMKADFGFSTSGFFFGISGSYGIPTS